jgi:hypothetical protein
MFIYIKAFPLQREYYSTQQAHSEERGRERKKERGRKEREREKDRGESGRKRERERERWRRKERGREGGRKNRKLPAVSDASRIIIISDAFNIPVFSFEDNLWGILNLSILFCLAFPFWCRHKLN